MSRRHPTWLRLHDLGKEQRFGELQVMRLSRDSEDLNYRRIIILYFGIRLIPYS